MTRVLNSKKVVITLCGIAAVLLLSVMGDLETLKYAGGLIAAMTSALVLGQGFADGWSKGRTSANGQGPDKG